MRIIFLTRRLYPDIGGVEKHVLEISKRLADKGFIITIITESQVGDEKELVYKNIEVIRIQPGNDTRFKKFRIWWILWRYRTLFQKADVIHAHDVFFWYLPFRFLFFKKPVYTTFHGYESVPIRKGAIRMRKLSERLSWGNICIGDYIQKWYGTKPSLVSYGGVAVSNLRTRAVQRGSGIFIGRLDQQTGILMYVKAVEMVKKKFP